MGTIIYTYKTKHKTYVIFSLVYILLYFIETEHEAQYEEYHLAMVFLFRFRVISKK